MAVKRWTDSIGSSTFHGELELILVLGVAAIIFRFVYIVAAIILVLGVAAIIFRFVNMHLGIGVVINLLVNVNCINLYECINRRSAECKSLKHIQKNSLPIFTIILGLTVACRVLLILSDLLNL